MTHALAKPTKQMEGEINKYLAALSVGVFTCLASASHAAVVYEFTAYTSSPGGPVGSFVYTAPTAITTNMTVDAASLDSCTISPGWSCGTMKFQVDDFGLYDVIGFTGGSITHYYYFADGAFSGVGTFDTVLLNHLHAGQLTIRQSNTPVSEPGSLTLLAAGLAGLWALRLRRRQRDTFKHRHKNGGTSR